MKDLDLVGTANEEQLALIVNNPLRSQAVDPDELKTSLLLFIDEEPPKRSATLNPTLPAPIPAVEITNPIGTDVQVNKGQNDQETAVAMVGAQGGDLAEVELNPPDASTSANVVVNNPNVVRSPTQPGGGKVGEQLDGTRPKILLSAAGLNKTPLTPWSPQTDPWERTVIEQREQAKRLDAFDKKFEELASAMKTLIRMMSEKEQAVPKPVVPEKREPRNAEVHALQQWSSPTAEPLETPAVTAATERVEAKMRP